jgi:hypothetical protein
MFDLNLVQNDIFYQTGGITYRDGRSTSHFMLSNLPEAGFGNCRHGLFSTNFT